MMLSLIADVLFDCRPMRWTDREYSVARLPLKVIELIPFRFNPLRGTNFDFLHEFRGGNGAGVREQEMDVILDRAGLQKRPPVILDDSSDVRVEFITNLIIYPWRALFGRKDDMNENFREGLGHGVSPFQGYFDFFHYPGFHPGLSHFAPSEQ